MTIRVPYRIACSHIGWHKGHSNFSVAKCQTTIFSSALLKINDLLEMRLEQLQGLNVQQRRSRWDGVFLVWIYCLQNNLLLSPVAWKVSLQWDGYPSQGANSHMVMFASLLNRSFPLMPCMLGKDFSTWHFEIFSLFVPENRLWHFMQIRRHFARNVKPISWK